ncbi:hypothetical protein Csa_019847 [Cucumis sativus]|uniref:Uncharacterized protein n=1 Tax=Cucumis sativus TaxID=3659 RepID=A0A0A0LZP7_CUCSA|nr:hypothetical protein Csa_019847 [Cucumis sativus]
MAIYTKDPSSPYFSSPIKMGDFGLALKLAADCAPAVATASNVVMTVAPFLAPVVAPVMVAATVVTSVTGVLKIFGI